MIWYCLGLGKPLITQPEFRELDGRVGVLGASIPLPEKVTMSFDQMAYYRLLDAVDEIIFRYLRAWEWPDNEEHLVFPTENLSKSDWRECYKGSCHIISCLAVILLQKNKIVPIRNT